MRNRHIFRMQYYQNVHNFLRDGIICSKNHNPMQRGYRISYDGIVNRRGTEYRTPKGESINEFVPFYFSPKTAMAGAIEYRKVHLIDPDGRDLGVANLSDVVFIICDTASFVADGPEFYFTDVSCNSAARQPTYEQDLDKLDDHIEWDLFDEQPIVAGIPEINYAGVCKWYHHKDEPARYKDRNKKRMAEFLVKDILPIEYVKCIVTENQRIKEQLDSWIKDSRYTIPTYVKKGCY